MAAVDAVGKKLVGPLFDNEKQIVRVTYDAAVDNLATADTVNLIEAQADCVITGFACHVETEFDSAGDALTIDVGVLGGDTDILLDGTAQAALTAGAVVGPTVVEGTPNVLALPLKLADGGKIALTKAGAAVTAGKCQFVFEIMKF